MNIGLERKNTDWCCKQQLRINKQVVIDEWKILQLPKGPILKTINPARPE